MKHLIHKIVKNLQTFLLGATCSLLLIFIVGATNAPNSIIIENEKFEMYNLAEEGKVLIFNKHSGEISYEEIEGDIVVTDYLNLSGDLDLNLRTKTGYVDIRNF